MNDYQPDVNSNPQPPIAFCQNCGKSLDAQTIRKVGTAVYCEPCLEARVAGNPPPPAGAASPYSNVFAGGPRPSGNVYPVSTGEPNPGLAALLGLIPGVGAMYNEQYAKGVAHLVIFAVLTMFVHVNGIFLLFVFGWIAYMSIEAHHTARARRDGTPLPNPFGFNDIGERMGFGAAWPNANPAAAARDAVNTAADHINAATSGFNRPPIVTPPPAAAQPADPSWGAPTDAYARPAYSQPYYQPYATPNPYAAPPYTPVSTPVFTAAPPPFSTQPNPMPVPTPSRFPAGAVWLIGLGMFFLLGTMGIFNSFPFFSLVGVFLLALGVWIFLRRMTETGQSISDDGSPSYQFRLLSALKGPIWLMTIGVLVLLHAFHLLSWGSAWPFLIILAGVMMILQRAVYNSAAATYHYPGAPSQTVPPSEVGYTATPPASERVVLTPEPTDHDTHEGGN